MRPLNVPLSADALPALDTCIKQTKAARCFRRAQAVREVVKGNRIHPVADPLTFPSSALRKWVHRFAREGVAGLSDRPRSGRPAQLTGELERQLNRLVEQAPLTQGAIHAQWSGSERAPVTAGAWR